MRMKHALSRLLRYAACTHTQTLSRKNILINPITILLKTKIWCEMPGDTLFYFRTTKNVSLRNDRKGNLNEKV